MKKSKKHIFSQDLFSIVLFNLLILNFLLQRQNNFHKISSLFLIKYLQIQKNVLHLHSQLRTTAVV